MNTDKLAINWQNFVRVRLQLKFAKLFQRYTYSILYKLKLDRHDNWYNRLSDYGMDQGCATFIFIIRSACEHILK